MRRLWVFVVLATLITLTIVALYIGNPVESSFYGRIWLLKLYADGSQSNALGTALSFDKSVLIFNPTQGLGRLEAEEAYVARQTPHKDLVFKNRSLELEFHKYFDASKLRRMKMPMDGAMKTLISNKTLPVARDLSVPTRVLVASACIGAQRQKHCQITHAQLRSYAAKHGYQALTFTDSVNASYDAHWQKVLIVKAQIEASLTGNNDTVIYDLIGWFDDDTYITNLDVRLENFFQLTDESSWPGWSPDLILSRDIDANDPYQFVNTAVFIVRANRYVLDFLNRIVQLYDVYPHFRTQPQWEQSVMTLAFFRWFASRTLVLPMCTLQSFFHHLYYQWKLGDFVIHFVDTPNPTRQSHLQAIASDSLENWSRKQSQRVTPCVSSRDKFS